MRLYLVRHGIAVSHGAAGVAEDDRPLTEEGIQKMRLSAPGLRNLGCIPEVLLSSPLPRARQTADILAAAFGPESSVKVCDALSPSGKREKVYEEIRRRGDSPSLMLVGHQPSLGEIAGEIAWGSPEYYIEIKKGGACALDMDIDQKVPRGTLLWLLTPSILRLIKPG